MLMLVGNWSGSLQKKELREGANGGANKTNWDEEMCLKLNEGTEMADRTEVNLCLSMF